MGHGPASDWGDDKAASFKSKLGIRLFILYTIVYIGFVALNTIEPASMGIIVFAGLNLAVVYGFGLIILAIVMGVIYNHLCTAAEDRLNQ